MCHKSVINLIFFFIFFWEMFSSARYMDIIDTSKYRSFRWYNSILIFIAYWISSHNNYYLFFCVNCNPLTQNTSALKLPIVSYMKWKQIFALITDKLNQWTIVVKHRQHHTILSSLKIQPVCTFVKVTCSDVVWPDTILLNNINIVVRY